MLSAMYSTFCPNTLNDILEEFKEKMEEGDEDIGIPVLEPFESDRLDIDLNEDGLFSATGRVRNLRISGLSNYKVLRADFPMDGLRAKVILLFHKIKIETQYRMEGTFLDDNSFNGHGTLTLVIKKLKVTTDLKLQRREGRLYVSNLELQIEMRESNCDITGLEVNDELSEDISETISEEAPDFLEEYQEEISEFVGRFVRRFINEILRNYAPGNLLSMIGG